MLDSFIIDEIKRREEARRQEQPRARLPIPGRAPMIRPPSEDPRDREHGREEGDEERGVLIIDYSASS